MGNSQPWEASLVPELASLAHGLSALMSSFGVNTQQRFEHLQVFVILLKAVLASCMESLTPAGFLPANAISTAQVLACSIVVA